MEDSKVLKARVESMEDELTKLRLESSKLVFDLRVEKTKVACLEEKLAKLEMKELSPLVPKSKNVKNFNVTVHQNNYGCIGMGGGQLTVSYEMTHGKTFVSPSKI
jgi:hypothetical protein